MLSSNYQSSPNYQYSPGLGNATPSPEELLLNNWALLSTGTGGYFLYKVNEYKFKATWDGHGGYWVFFEEDTGGRFNPKHASKWPLRLWPVYEWPGTIDLADEHQCSRLQELGVAPRPCWGDRSSKDHEVDCAKFHGKLEMCSCLHPSNPWSDYQESMLATGRTTRSQCNGGMHRMQFVRARCYFGPKEEERRKEHRREPGSGFVYFLVNFSPKSCIKRLWDPAGTPTDHRDAVNGCPYMHGCATIAAWERWVPPATHEEELQVCALGAQECEKRFEPAEERKWDDPPVRRPPQGGMALVPYKGFDMDHHVVVAFSWGRFFPISNCYSRDSNYTTQPDYLDEKVEKWLDWWHSRRFLPENGGSSVINLDTLEGLNEQGEPPLFSVDGHNQISESEYGWDKGNKKRFRGHVEGLAEQGGFLAAIVLEVEQGFMEAGQKLLCAISPAGSRGGKLSPYRLPALVQEASKSVLEEVLLAMGSGGFLGRLTQLHVEPRLRQMGAQIGVVAPFDCMELWVEITPLLEEAVLQANRGNAGTLDDAVQRVGACVRMQVLVASRGGGETECSRWVRQQNQEGGWNWVRDEGLSFHGNGNWGITGGILDPPEKNMVWTRNSLGIGRDPSELPAAANVSRRLVSRRETLPYMASDVMHCWGGKPLAELKGHFLEVGTVCLPWSRTLSREEAKQATLKSQIDPEPAHGAEVAVVPLASCSSYSGGVKVATNLDRMRGPAGEVREGRPIENGAEASLLLALSLGVETDAMQDVTRPLNGGRSRSNPVPDKERADQFILNYQQELTGRLKLFWPLLVEQVMGGREYYTSQAAGLLCFLVSRHGTWEVIAPPGTGKTFAAVGVQLVLLLWAQRYGVCLLPRSPALPAAREDQLELQEAVVSSTAVVVGRANANFVVNAHSVLQNADKGCERPLKFHLFGPPAEPGSPPEAPARQLTFAVVEGLLKEKSTEKGGPERSIKAAFKEFILKHPPYGHDGMVILQKRGALFPLKEYLADFEGETHQPVMHEEQQKRVERLRALPGRLVNELWGDCLRGVSQRVLSCLEEVNFFWFHRLYDLGTVADKKQKQDAAAAAAASCSSNYRKPNNSDPTNRGAAAVVSRPQPPTFQFSETESSWSCRVMAGILLLASIAHPDANPGEEGDAGRKWDVPVAEAAFRWAELCFEGISKGFFVGFLMWGTLVYCTGTQLEDADGLRHAESLIVDEAQGWVPKDWMASAVRVRPVKLLALGDPFQFRNTTHVQALQHTPRATSSMMWGEADPVKYPFFSSSPLARQCFEQVQRCVQNCAPPPKHSDAFKRLKAYVAGLDRARVELSYQQRMAPCLMHVLSIATKVPLYQRMVPIGQVEAEQGSEGRGEVDSNHQKSHSNHQKSQFELPAEAKWSCPDWCSKQWDRKGAAMLGPGHFGQVHFRILLVHPTLVRDSKAGSPQNWLLARAVLDEISKCAETPHEARRQQDRVEQVGVPLAQGREGKGPPVGSACRVKLAEETPSEKSIRTTSRGQVGSFKESIYLSATFETAASVQQHQPRHRGQSGLVDKVIERTALNSAPADSLLLRGPKQRPNKPAPEDSNKPTLLLVTPYRGEVLMYTDLLFGKHAPYRGLGDKFHVLTPCTVDTAAGREADYVVLDTVWDDRSRDVSFLNHERVCVSLSRPRYGLWVVGTDALFQNAFLKAFGAEFERCGEPNVGQAAGKVAEVSASRPTSLVGQGGCFWECEKIHSGTR